MFNWKKITLSIALISLFSCSQQAENVNSAIVAHAPTATLTGTVAYRERIILPDNAVLKVSLEDSAKQDVTATTISEQTIQLTTPPPWAFELDYQPEQIETTGRYTLRARVEVDGKLRFINMDSTLAFSSPEPINILVKAVVEQPSADNQTMLQVHPWQLIELNGKPLSDKTKRSMLTISFDAEKKQTSGFSGCNSFSGGYIVSETKLMFMPLMSTMMACEKNGLESDYLQALAKIDNYQMDGTRLKMFNKNSHLLLQFDIKKPASE